MVLEMMPRITRVQKMDALSEMATGAGYCGVLLDDGAEWMMWFVRNRGLN
jgi:NAD/NADP transhydrogenase alpha subunit